MLFEVNSNIRTHLNTYNLTTFPFIPCKHVLTQYSRMKTAHLAIIPENTTQNTIH